MRNHRLATLVAAAAMATASSLAVASSAHAATSIVELQSAWTFECLQPAGGSSGLGVAIVQDTCNGSLAQQWTEASSSSGFHLVNRSTGLCLDARGGAVSGTPIEQWTCDWITNENWKYDGGQQLHSGVSGTYTECITIPGVLGQPLPSVELGLCTDGIWQIWYLPSP